MKTIRMLKWMWSTVLGLALVLLALPSCALFKAHAAETTIAGLGGAAAVAIGGPVGLAVGAAGLAGGAIAGESLAPHKDEQCPPSQPTTINVTGNGNKFTVANTEAKPSFWHWYYTVICGLGVILLVPRIRDLFDSWFAHMKDAAYQTVMHAGATVGFLHSRPAAPDKEATEQLEPAIGFVAPKPPPDPEEDEPASRHKSWRPQ